MDDANVWLFPETREILVTDQTGGVPVDATECYHFKSWHEALVKSEQLKREHAGWEIRYDSRPGRELEAEV